MHAREYPYFFNGTDASYMSRHHHMSILVIQDPMQNRKVLGNCYFYTYNPDC